MSHKTRRVLFMIAVLFVAACAAKPVTAPRIVVPETVPEELRVSATAAKTFGNMVAIGVGLSNGSTRQYVVEAERVLAIDAAGNQIAPISLEEAARQAGGATALAAGLRGAAGGGFMAGLLGAVTGGILGAGSGSPGKGAAIGAGVGVATGAIGGYYESKSKTEREIIDQLGGLYLGQRMAEPGLPVSGFVFFPAGQYQSVRALLVEKASGSVLEVRGPVFGAV